MNERQTGNPLLSGYDIAYTEHSHTSKSTDDLLLLDAERYRKMNEKRKLHHRSGVTALEMIFDPDFGDKAIILEGRGGCITRGEDVISCWSISHTDYGAVAVLSASDSQIGVDMEPRGREVSDGALHEITGYNPCWSPPYRSNLRTWMAIEAISKALGYGLRISKDVVYSNGRWRYGELQWNLDFLDTVLGEVPHIVSVASVIKEGP